MMSNYFQASRENEVVFRNVLLRDLKENRAQRPMGIYVPEDLETETELEVIFEKYSSGIRYGRFTITDFAVGEEGATIRFENVAMMSGGGASFRYSVCGKIVKYQEAEDIFMS